MDPQRPILFAGGVALGALALFVLRPGPQTAGDATLDPALLEELAALRRSQDDIAAALERLADATRDSALAPVDSGATPGRAPVGDTRSLTKVAASLDALRASIETESRRTQEVIRSAPAFGGETLGDVRRRHADTDWNQLDTLEEDWRADEGAANRSQYFQTARDLLAKYGPPSAIYRPKGSLLYVYRRHAEGKAGPAWYFRVQDGYVVEFFLEDEEEEG